MFVLDQLHRNPRFEAQEVARNQLIQRNREVQVEILKKQDPEVEAMPRFTLILVEDQSHQATEIPNRKVHRLKKN